MRDSRLHRFKEFDKFRARVNESRIFVIYLVSDSGYDRIYRRWTAGGHGEFRPFEKDSLNELLDLVGRNISDSLSALVCHGVFDRFFRRAYCRAREPFVMARTATLTLRANVQKMPNAFRPDPVESFKKHLFTAPFYEDPVDKVAELMGADRVLFGSDWPQPEGLKHPLDFFEDTEDLNDADTKLIMQSNLTDHIEGKR
ncbi:amidohydrolase 2 [Burkholderia sp. H160]|nr:amidohydrolase 2 [Burkholderia sp. H160]